MKLTRSRFDDVRWAITSRTGKLTISLTLVIAMVIGGWAMSPQAVAWFYDTTGLVPAEVQAERDREQELRLDLSVAIPRAQATLDEMPDDESLEGPKESLGEAISVGEIVFEDQSTSSEEILSAIEGIDRAESRLGDAFEAYEARLLDEGYEQLEQAIDRGVDLFNDIKGDDDYDSQSDALRDAIRQARAVLEDRELDLVGVQESRQEILDAISAVEERAEEIEEEEAAERERQREREREREQQQNQNQNQNQSPPPTQTQPPPAQPPTQPPTQRASTSMSMTCSSTETVTISASGGGTVSVSVSGAASGSNSGSGSASVTVTAQGTINATATADGNVSISASATATCR